MKLYESNVQSYQRDASEVYETDGAKYIDLAEMDLVESADCRGYKCGSVGCRMYGR